METREQTAAKKMMSWFDKVIRKYVVAQEGIITAVIITHPRGMTVLSGPYANRDYLKRRLAVAVQVVSQGDFKSVGELKAFEVKFPDGGLIKVM